MCHGKPWTPPVVVVVSTVSTSSLPAFTWLVPTCHRQLVASHGVGWERWERDLQKQIQPRFHHIHHMILVEKTQTQHNTTQHNPTNQPNQTNPTQTQPTKAFQGFFRFGSASAQMRSMDTTLRGELTIFASASGDTTLDFSGPWRAFFGMLVC